MYDKLSVFKANAYYRTNPNLNLHIYFLRHKFGAFLLSRNMEWNKFIYTTLKISRAIPELNGNSIIVYLIMSGELS